MSLHDQIEEDLSIFLDLDEMAAKHTVCLPGDPAPREIAAVVDNDEGQQNALRSQSGVYSGTVLFYAKTSDVSGITANSMIQFDDRPYQVAGIVEEDGMTQVTLQAGEGGF
ncbi:MAG TPA: hypothetical protein VHR42_10565 [Clostridia bacterium]|nr:hypothetical protein [Clostridia bacterium]